jgi:GNAT superfamily N-acetyltransferase
MAGFLIRPATTADLASLAEQSQLLNIHEARTLPDRRTDRAGGRLAAEELCRHVAAEGGEMRVAEIGGVVVAHMVMWFASLGPASRPECRRYAYVGDLFVRAAWRGQGLGRTLMAEAERIASDRGVPAIRLAVVTGNIGAEQTYRGLGYRSGTRYLMKTLPRE